jgi:site-specific DNA-methyltransferase (adenine-specific)
LPTLDADSVDACVTDPPYGLGFMAKEWDVPGGLSGFPMRRSVALDAVNTGNSRQGGRQRSCEGFQKRQARDARAYGQDSERWAAEVFRVLKPGGYVLAFGGTRTFHRLTCGIEDAGFEIRDCLSWLYGQGFPKSLNLGNGRGTALKPAWEPIVMARKPTIGTVAANILRHSTGALNIDACRIDAEPWHREPGENPKAWSGRTYAQDEWTKTHMGVGKNRDGNDPGRWPANVALDEDAASMLDKQSGELARGANPTRRSANKHRNVYQGWKGEQTCLPARGSDAGGASRFYYVAKAGREEREMGCHDLAPRQRDESRKDGNPGGNNPRNRGLQPRGNFHPTVKPLDLMRWLVRLVTPPGGLVLDPFVGSGTTGMACAAEGLRFVGIEREAEYIEIAERRIASIAPLFDDQTEAVP